MKKYNGIHFDRIIATSLVYSSCQHDRGFQPNCRDCIIREQFKTVSYLQRFDFQYVVPPWLYNNIFQSHGVFGVSTKGVMCLYLASAYLLDIMFDPKAEPVAGTSKSWMKLAAPHRKRGQQIWDSTLDLFLQNLKAANSALEFIQVQERRVWEGLGLCLHINKKEPEGGWKKWVDDQVEKYGSRQLIPWTINRCLADETDPQMLGLEADNKHKHDLMEYEEQYNAKHQPAPPTTAPEETKEEEDVGGEDDEEDTTAQDQEHMKKFLAAVEQAELDMSGATKKKRKNRKKKKKTTAASVPTVVADAAVVEG